MIGAPYTDGLNIVNKRNAYNADIIQVLESNFAAAKENVKNFAAQFHGRTDEQTAQNVFNFLKARINYKRDPDSRQLIRIPGRFIKDREGDCKSYALSACSILANLGFQTSFRYTSYNGSTTPTHVYCVAERNGKQFIVDGVYHTFNKEKPYRFKIDHKMNIETLSGFNPLQKRTALDINNREHLQAVYNRMPVKTNLAARVIAKRLTGSGTVLKYSDQQLLNYKYRLSNAIARSNQAFVKAVLQDELAKVNAGNVTGGIFGTADDQAIAGKKKGRVKKFFKKVGAKAKTIGLAPSRAAFLTLVRLNVKGLATKLLKASTGSHLKKTWEKLGGNYSKLIQTAQAGSKKKMIGDNIAGIGSASAIAATLATAAPIIAALAYIFRKDKSKGDLMPGELSTGESLMNSLDLLKGAAIDAGVLPSVLQNADAAGSDIAEDKVEVEKESFLSGNMLPLVVGAGALLYFSKK